VVMRGRVQFASSSAIASASIIARHHRLRSTLGRSQMINSHLFFIMTLAYVGMAERRHLCGYFLTFWCYIDAIERNKNNTQFLISL
jgi:hypothetical protein